MAPRVLIANANLVGDWANWDEFRRLDALGLTMYGQMTAGSWIYIGTQGILQGTYQTFAAAGAEALRRRPGRQARPDGRPRRHGRRAAARRHHGRRRRALRRGRSAPHRAAPRDRATWTSPRTRSTRRSSWPTRRSRRASRSRSPCSATPPTSTRSSCAAASRPTSSPTRRRRTTSLNGYVPNGMTLDEALVLRREDPDEYVRRAVASIVVHVEAMVALQKAGATRLRLRQQHPRRGQGGRLRRRLRLPRLRPGLHPSALLPRQRPVPLGGAQRRPAGHRRHRRRPPRGVPGQRDGHPLDQDGRREGPRSRACPAASAGSSTASAPRPARSSTSWCAPARSRRRS